MYKPKDSIRYSSRKLIEQAMQNAGLQMIYSHPNKSYIKVSQLVDNELLQWLERFGISLPSREEGGRYNLQVDYDENQASWTLYYSPPQGPLDLYSQEVISVPVNDPEFDLKLANHAKQSIVNHCSYLAMVRQTSLAMKARMSSLGLRLMFIGDRDDFYEGRSVAYNDEAMEAGIVSREIAVLLAKNNAPTARDSVRDVWTGVLVYERPVSVGGTEYLLAHSFGLQFHDGVWKCGWQRAYTGKKPPALSKRVYDVFGGGLEPEELADHDQPYFHDVSIDLSGNWKDFFEITININDHSDTQYVDRIAEYVYRRVGECERFYLNKVHGQ